MQLFDALEVSQKNWVELVYQLAEVESLAWVFFEHLHQQPEQLVRVPGLDLSQQLQ